MGSNIISGFLLIDRHDRKWRSIINRKIFELRIFHLANIRLVVYTGSHVQSVEETQQDMIRTLVGQAFFAHYPQKLGIIASSGLHQVVVGERDLCLETIFSDYKFKIPPEVVRF